MICPHAETTTLLWISGEAEPPLDETHSHHVASCEDCQQVLALHADVAAAVAPIAPALAQTVPPTYGSPGFELQDAPDGVRRHRALQGSANRHFPWPWVAAMAAAALVLALLSTSHDVVDAPVAPQLAAAPSAREGEVDAALEAVDLELADLSFDLETL